MNKKHFLLALPVCLIFCLGFTTCDEYEEVTDLWEKIRNTAWSMNKTYSDDGGEFEYNITIGFYAPYNGPSPSYNYSSNSDVYPYVVIRFYWIDKAPYWSSAKTNFFNSFNLEIDKTGNIISSVDTFINVNNKPYKTSFNITVNGEKLTISKAKMSDIYEAERHNGTYFKISSDPKYDWGRMQWDNWE